MSDLFDPFAPREPQPALEPFVAPEPEPDPFLARPVELEPFDIKDAAIAWLREAMKDAMPPGRLLAVLPCFPSGPQLLPCLSVTQGPGSMEVQTIGNQWGPPLIDEETGEEYDVEGVYWRQSVKVVIWALHPEERDRLAKRLRHRLWRLIKKLSDEDDVKNASASEQGDDQDLESEAPKDVYLYAFDISGLVPVLDAVVSGPATGLSVSVEFH